ncbi:hypothetical protein [Cellulosimicrobium sp. Marseille-Q4280]|uniref:hypothetical protein n=1 Tax=Cellulosimicrobium sp. Marseille-Q4280 TaxID=2937992 RepID=UPI0020426604|nr:hypothetical protein [Cellulosimicrobium sp. Marseille-Q4280]
MTDPTTTDLEAALDLVRACGYVAIKEKSYRAAETRHAVTKAQLADAREDVERAEAWARRALDGESRARDRVEFVYGVARRFGATVEELTGPADEAVYRERIGAVMAVAESGRNGYLPCDAVMSAATGGASDCTCEPRQPRGRRRAPDPACPVHQGAR